MRGFVWRLLAGLRPSRRRMYRDLGAGTERLILPAWDETSSPEDLARFAADVRHHWAKMRRAGRTEIPLDDRLPGLFLTEYRHGSGRP